MAPDRPDDIAARAAAWRALPRGQRAGRIREERDPALLGAYLPQATGVERMAVIAALGETGSSDAEPYLIEVLRTSTDRYALATANAALGRVGSHVAIPELARFIHHDADDIKASALDALARLGDPSLTPLFLDALGDRSWVAKWYAMAALHRHGDERAIEPVADRVHAMLARRRKQRIAGWSELMYALDFLRRHAAGSESAAAALEWAAARMDRFTDAERAWFAEASRSRPAGGRSTPADA